MRQVIRKLRLPSLLVILGLAASTASAAVFEFNPTVPVTTIVGAPNSFPPPPLGPVYYNDPNHIYGNYIQVKDGFGGYNALDGLDGTPAKSLQIVVNNVNTPITRVEVLLTIVHPHLNDLAVSLQSPSGDSVTLINGISQAGAAVISRATANPDVYNYVGSIGGQFSVFPTPPGFDGYGPPLEPVTLVSELDEDDLSGGQVVPFINDPAILDQRPTSNTYLNTVATGLYRSQGDLRKFNGLSGNGRANGTWILKIVDSKQNNFVNVIDPVTNQPKPRYVYYGQGVVYAQIIIHQQGGYNIWTGSGPAGNNNWSNANNWDPKYGVPTIAQPASVIFSNSTVNAGAKYVPNNDLGNLRIADINITQGTSPYDIRLNNVTFYKRCRIQNDSGTNAITFTGGATQSTGRIKLDIEAGALSFTGPITGQAGIKKFGQGLAILDGASTFTGTSVIEAGILRLMTPTALGGSGALSGTTIRSAGIVEFAGGMPAAIAEPVTLTGNGSGSGAMHLTSGTQTWSGEITLNSTNTGVQVDTGATLVIQDFNQTVVNGAAGFSIRGGGTMSLTGTVDALFPPTTQLAVIGSTLSTTVAQTHLGNLILSDGITIGGGALYPRDLNGSISANTDDIVSNGTSSIANPVNFAGGSRSIGVNSGTLTVTGVISNGSLVKNGGGTLALDGTSTGLPVSVAQGVLAGSGGVGALSVTKGGVLNPTNTFDVSQAVFAAQSAFIVDGANDRLISAGNVTLSGADADGIGGAVLQVYENGPADGAVIITGANTGSFEGLPRNAAPASITYNAGASVSLGSGGADVGKLVWFNPTSYRVKESAGTIQVTVQWSGATGDAVLRHYGGNAVRDYNLDIGDNDTGTAASPIVTYTVTIPQNYVDTGDVTTTLALVPLRGARLAASPTPPGASVATITVLDDDVTDQKTCGFGTGLTVFLLLGFGLLLNVRLRRR